MLNVDLSEPVCIFVRRCVWIVRSFKWICQKFQVDLSQSSYGFVAIFMSMCQKLHVLLEAACEFVMSFVMTWETFGIVWHSMLWYCMVQ